MPSSLQFSALSILLVYTFALPAQADFSNQVAYPQFEKEVLKPANISSKYSDANKENLILLLQKKIANYNAEEKVDKDAVELLSYAYRLLNQNYPAEKQNQEAYIAAEQILYAVITDDYTETSTLFETLLKSPKFIVNYFDLANVSIPYMWNTPDKTHYYKSLTDRPSLSAAQKEANNLVRNAEDTRFVSPEEMTKMTYEEISQLDISDNNSVWKSNHLKSQEKNQDYWRSLEKYTEASIQEKLKTNDYTLDSARRIMFFDKIKDTATAPKVNVQDSFGIPWKIKWGAEIHIENINNRLYLAAGGKFADLNYVVEPGKTGTTLILQKEGVRTPEDLILAMKQSVYAMDLSQQIQTSGQITKANIQDVLSLFPKSKQTKAKKEDLIGRYFVTFKEASLTYKGDAGVVYGGGTNLNSGQILNDRASRGQLVYDMWIWNQDVKEDNNSSVLVKNTTNESEYIEYRHDMGSALGKRFFKGEVSNIGIGSDFLSHSIGDYGRSIVFHQPIYFKPKVWRKTRYTDARWMAKQILQIPKDKIQQAIDSALLPDFFKQVLLYKLQSRRVTLAKMFHLPIAEADKNLVIPQVNVALGTHTDRMAAAKKYAISVDILEKEMRDVGLLQDDEIARDKNGNLYVDKMLYSDVNKQWVGYKPSGIHGKPDCVYSTVTDVKIQQCEDTVLLGLLTRVRYVNGITKMLVSSWDQVPLAECHYGKKYKPATGREKLMRTLSNSNLL